MSPQYTTTRRGDLLASHLSPYITTTHAVRVTCARIARLAATHHRLQEMACNGELTPAETARDTRVEALIRTLVADLPHASTGAITVRFQGDPRGYTVRLVVPNQPHAGNTWGLGGEFGV